MQFNLFTQGAQLTAPTNISGRAIGKHRAAHVIHPARAKSVSCDGLMVRRFAPGKAEGVDELTKKRARAIGMFEGWREVVNEPVRQRVGLAGMQY